MIRSTPALSVMPASLEAAGHESRQVLASQRRVARFLRKFGVVRKANLARPMRLYVQMETLMADFIGQTLLPACFISGDQRVNPRCLLHAMVRSAVRLRAPCRTRQRQERLSLVVWKRPHCSIDVHTLSVVRDPLVTHGWKRLGACRKSSAWIRM